MDGSKAVLVLASGVGQLVSVLLGGVEENERRGMEARFEGANRRIGKLEWAWKKAMERYLNWKRRTPSWKERLKNFRKKKAAQK
jgi:hypothetical protein